MIGLAFFFGLTVGICVGVTLALIWVFGDGWIK